MRLVAACSAFHHPRKIQEPSQSSAPRTEVHRVLGTGFLEILYKDALEIEFNERQVPFQREAPCLVEYKGRPLRRDYHVDFICFGEIILEIKARSVTGPADHALVISYLASTKKRYGLLLNFGAPKLEHRRFIWEPKNAL